MIPPPARRGGAPQQAMVYLLRSQRTGRCYLGWTMDLLRRLAQHREGQSPYTRARGPWKLVALELHATVESAKARERQLKHNPRMRALFTKRALAGLQPPAIRRRLGQVVG